MVIIEFGGVIMTAIITAWIVKCCVTRHYHQSDRHLEPVEEPMLPKGPEESTIEEAQELEEIPTVEVVKVDATTQTSTLFNYYRPRLYEYAGTESLRKKYFKNETKL
jgi:hypothetical protein